MLRFYAEMGTRTPLKGLSLRSPDLSQIRQGTARAVGVCGGLSAFIVAAIFLLNLPVAEWLDWQVLNTDGAQGRPALTYDRSELEYLMSELEQSHEVGGGIDLGPVAKTCCSTTASSDDRGLGPR